MAVLALLTVCVNLRRGRNIEAVRIQLRVDRVRAIALPDNREEGLRIERRGAHAGRDGKRYRGLQASVNDEHSGRTACGNTRTRFRRDGDGVGDQLAVQRR